MLPPIRNLVVAALWLCVHLTSAQYVWPNLAVDELEDIVFLTSGKLI